MWCLYRMLIKKRFLYFDSESKKFSSDKFSKMAAQGSALLDFFLFDFPEERLPPLLPRYLCCFFFLDAFFLDTHHT